MKILSVGLSLVLILVCNSAMAQWQWLDKDGRKVFSDRAPPPDVMDKDILKRPNGSIRTPVAKEATGNDVGNNLPADASGARPAPLASGVDRDLEAKKKQAADAEAAKKKAEEDRNTKTRIENCARAKQALASFDGGLRIARTNANGEREIMDDASRAAERNRIQNLMNSDCR